MLLDNISFCKKTISSSESFCSGEFRSTLMKYNLQKKEKHFCLAMIFMPASLDGLSWGSALSKLHYDK